MAHFYATANDLLPVLLNVESKMSISYTRTDLMRNPDIVSYASGLEIPTLFAPAPHESSVEGPAYLVTERNFVVSVREIALRDGSKRWALDQLANPDSTVFRHGGVFENQFLLHGEVRSAYKTLVALKLQRTFDSAIRKHFAKVRAFYLGPEAEKMFDAGFRLTMSGQSPPEYNLRR